MDHLPAPRDPTAPLPIVPYVCDGEDQYDWGEFLTYPTRIGVPQLSSIQGAILFRAWEARESPVSDRDVEVFCQAWIFFGLLHEVLGKHDLFSVNHYVEADGTSAKCVHTKNLTDQLRRWTEILHAWDEGRREEELHHLVACLRLAREANYLLVAEHHPSCNRAIVWSISIILETIQNAIDLAFGGPRSIVAPSTLEITLSQAEIDHMLRNGWCIHEVMCALREWSCIHGKFYIQRLRRPNLGHDHSECDEENCRRLQIDLPTYQPRHNVDGCTCSWTGPTPREVAMCLNHDTFPILKVSEGHSGQVNINVVPYEVGMVYVALSHVWADGLGNPAANRLPQCQFIRLRRLVEAIRDGKVVHLVDEGVKQAPKAAIAYPDARREIFIWCDTICCPVQSDDDPFSEEELKALQSKAIAKLRDVYLLSAYVLVLDRSLETIDFSTADPVENAMRVFTSRWVRRLWTFQEGGIGTRLLISFQNAIVDFRTIWAGIHPDAAPEPATHDLTLRRQMHNHCFNLRSWFNQRNATIDYRGVIWSLCWRRVSVPADEPLCVAAAYNLDVEAVTQKPYNVQDRMSEVWRQLALTPTAISAFVIFNALPRLQNPGFHWAPSSILQTVKDGTILEFVFGNLQDSKGTLATHGFRVEFSGWKLGQCGPPGRLPISIMSTDEPDMHYCRDPGGQWYSAWEHKELRPEREIRLNHLIGQDREDHDQQWHIILDVCEEGQEIAGRRALVTSSSPSATSSNVHYSEKLVYVKRLAPQWEAIYEAVYSRVYPLRTDWKVTAISDLADSTSSSIDDAWGRIAEEMYPDVYTYTGSNTPTPPALLDLCRDLIKQINAEMEPLEVDEELGQAGREVHAGGNSVAHVMKSVFIGRVIPIETVYGDSTEWIVD